MESVRGKSSTCRDIATETYDFWTTFWSDNAQDEQSENTEVQTLKTYAATAQVNWQDPSTDEVIKVAQLQSGSAGVDGWKGEELKHLPPDTLRMFRNLALSWRHRALQFLEARCVQIRKASKVMHGCLKVDQVRPITVMSAWWRLWSSCLVKCASTWPLPPYIRLLVRITMDALLTSANVMTLSALRALKPCSWLVIFLLIGSQLSDSSFGINNIESERFFGVCIVIPPPLNIQGDPLRITCLSGCMVVLTGFRWMIGALARPHLKVFWPKKALGWLVWKGWSPGKWR